MSKVMKTVMMMALMLIQCILFNHAAAAYESGTVYNPSSDKMLTFFSLLLFFFACRAQYECALFVRSPLLSKYSSEIFFYFLFFCDTLVLHVEVPFKMRL